MKRRVVTPSKILAVALTAGLGCSTSARPDSAQPAEPKPAPSSLPAAASGGEGAVATQGRSEDPKLVALRGELDIAGRESALAKETHFRPLCDEEGYPLVGNLVRKSPGQPFQPSAFCAEVRAKKAQR
jgi:hypothetical protein